MPPGQVGVDFFGIHIRNHAQGGGKGCLLAHGPENLGLGYGGPAAHMLLGTVVEPQKLRQLACEKKVLDIDVAAPAIPCWLRFQSLFNGPVVNCLSILAVEPDRIFGQQYAVEITVHKGEHVGFKDHLVKDIQAENRFHQREINTLKQDGSLGITAIAPVPVLEHTALRGIGQERGQNFHENFSLDGVKVNRDNASMASSTFLASTSEKNPSRVSAVVPVRPVQAKFRY